MFCQQSTVNRPRYYSFKEFINACIIFTRVSILEYSSLNFSSEIYVLLFAKYKQPTTSNAERFAITRNLLNSVFVKPVDPSTIFNETELAALGSDLIKNISHVLEKFAQANQFHQPVPGITAKFLNFQT
jgi:hypothetical protein